jgi:hypothetical protein
MVNTRIILGCYPSSSSEGGLNTRSRLVCLRVPEPARIRTGRAYYRCAGCMQDVRKKKEKVSVTKRTKLRNERNASGILEPRPCG